MPSSPHSAPLAHEKVETLKFLWGLTIAQYLALGIQATLFVITVYILASQGLRAAKARVILLCITFVMFANSLIAYSILSHGHMEFLESLSGDSAREDDDTSLRLTIVANSLLRLNFLLSDAIVVWRAWVFWPRNRVVQGVLLVCFVGTVGTMLADNIRIALSFYGKGPEVGAGAGAVMVSLPPLVTNLVATGLVGLKAWTYSRETRQYLEESVKVDRSTPVGKVLLLLIESGLLYSVLWVFLLSNNLVETDLAGDISAMVTGMSISLAGIYPMLVIILVALKRSYAETMFGSNVIPVSRPIEFGHPGTETSTEGSAKRTVEDISLSQRGVDE